MAAQYLEKTLQYNYLMKIRSSLSAGQKSSPSPFTKQQIPLGQKHATKF